jgi:hypothetical protein
VVDGGPAQPAFRIVPGNHDRYDFLGNRLKLPFTKPRARYKALLFENAFPGALYPTAEAAVDLQLGSAQDGWKVRVIGMDSNHPASWFAQGAVEETAAARVARSALDATQSDLVIALVHHHVLPIPAVERRAGGLTATANTTGMLNAGVLMGYLSEAQVNLVLHGHEHSPHQASFSGAGPFAGSTVVLAAGSATGEETLQHWALDRVHFNVLELEADRSVYLLQVRHGAMGLALEPQRRLLLNGVDIRRSRFVRRNRLQTRRATDLPTSRIKKLFRLEIDRSAAIVESRTDFAVGESWSLTTRSASGHLDPEASVEFEWPSGEISAYVTPFVPALEVDAEAYRCGLPLNRGARVLARRTTASWRWWGAVLLRTTDFELLPEVAKTGPRRQGREFVVLKIDADGEFKSASLTLALPLSCAPASQSFRVDWEDPDRPGVLTASQELTKALEFCGPGHVELRIPYPMPGYRYYLSWTPVDNDPLQAEADALAQRIRTDAAALLATAAKTLETAGGAGLHGRLSLYGASADSPLQWERLAGDAAAPAQLPLNLPRSRVRTAALGGLQAVARGDDEGHDLMPDESLLAIVPVRLALADGTRASALLRIAAPAAAGLQWDPLEPMPPAVEAFFDASLLAASDILRVATARR